MTVGNIVNCIPNIKALSIFRIIDQTDFFDDICLTSGKSLLVNIADYPAINIDEVVALAALGLDMGQFKLPGICQLLAKFPNQLGLGYLFKDIALFLFTVDFFRT